MDWQQVAALMIVAVAAGLLLRSKLRRRKFGLERDLPCGCSAARMSSPGSSIVFRARKGHRPEVVVKMR